MQTFLSLRHYKAYPVRSYSKNYGHACIIPKKDKNVQSNDLTMDFYTSFPLKSPTQYMFWEFIVECKAYCFSKRAFLAGNPYN